MSMCHGLLPLYIPLPPPTLPSIFSYSIASITTIPFDRARANHHHQHSRSSCRQISTRSSPSARVSAGHIDRAAASVSEHRAELSSSRDRDASERTERAWRGRPSLSHHGRAGAGAVVQDGLLLDVRLHAAESPVHRRRVPRQGGEDGSAGEGAAGKDIALRRRRRAVGRRGEDDTQGDHRRGAARGGSGRARPVRQRQVDAAVHPRWPPRRPLLRHGPNRRPRPVPRGAAPYGVRCPGRHPPPAPHRARDPRLLRHAAPPHVRPDLRQARRGRRRDRGAGPHRLRRHDRGQRVRARRVRRRAEAREHRARAAGEPEPAGTRRAHLGAGLHRRVPAGDHPVFTGAQGAHGGAVGAPAVQPRVPGLRHRAAALRGQLHVPRARARRHGLLRLRGLRAGLPRQPGRLHARPRQWLCASGVQRPRGGGRQRQAVAHRLLRQGARPQGQGRHQQRRRRRARGHQFGRAAAGELQRVHQLDEPVRHPAPAQPQGAPPRDLHLAPPLPDHRAGAGGGGHVVALHAAPGAGPDGPPLLHLHLLGRLRLLQRRLRLPAGAPRPRPRARLRHVLPLLLLHVQDGRRPAHGARLAHRLHRHRLPHGRPQPGARGLRAHRPRHPLLRARRRGARARHRRPHDGRQARLHARHRHHARLPPHRRLLRAQRACLHDLGQVLLLHLLLLPAAHRRAVQRTPRPAAPARVHARRGQHVDLRRGPRRHVLRVPPARLLRPPPGQDVINTTSTAKRAAAALASLAGQVSTN